MLGEAMTPSSIRRPRSMGIRRVLAQFRSSCPCASRRRTAYRCYASRATIQVRHITGLVLDSTAGSPLTLDQLRQSTLFSPTALSSAPTLHDDRGGAEPTAPAHFPVVTPLEHPVTGRPCFSLHPCETGSALDAVLGPDRVDPAVYIQSWFALVGSVVDLRD